MENSAVSPPLISYIIPTFRAGDKLFATLGSIEVQQPGNCEVVVVDGGSADGTQASLRAHHSPVPFRWISEMDDGVYDAMNKGIGLSKGRFLCFLGAGDELRPDTVRAVTEIIERTQDERLLLIYGDVLWKSRGVVHGGPFNQWRITTQCMCHQGMYFQREIFQKFGLYDTRYRTSADYAKNIAIFGDSGVKKVHLARILADYEGGGLSEMEEDTAFIADVESIVVARLHPLIGAAYRLRRRAPRGLKKLLRKPGLQ